MKYLNTPMLFPNAAREGLPGYGRRRSPAGAAVPRHRYKRIFRPGGDGKGTRFALVRGRGVFLGIVGDFPRFP
jgi:hypothetical protein